MKTNTLQTEIDETLLFLAQMDLNLYGYVTDGTKEAFAVQNVELPEKYKMPEVIKLTIGKNEIEIFHKGKESIKNDSILIKDITKIIRESISIDEKTRGFWTFNDFESRLDWRILD